MNRFIVKPNMSVKQIIELSHNRTVFMGAYNGDIIRTESSISKYAQKVIDSLGTNIASEVGITGEGIFIKGDDGEWIKSHRADGLPV